MSMKAKKAECKDPQSARKSMIAKDKKLRERIISGLNSGYYFVSAPPGCGKTRLLASRVVNRLAAALGNEEGVEDSAERLLCLTFTLNAADEMKEQIKKVAEESDLVTWKKERIANAVEDGKHIVVSDLHSLALRILKAHYPAIENNQTLYLKPEQNDIVFDSIFKKPSKSKGKNDGAVTESTPKLGQSDAESSYIEGYGSFPEEYRALTFRLSNFIRLFSWCVSVGGLTLNSDITINSMDGLKAAGRAIQKFGRRKKKLDIFSCLLYEYKAIKTGIKGLVGPLRNIYSKNKAAQAIKEIPKCANLIYEDKKKNFWIDYNDSLIDLYTFLEYQTTIARGGIENNISLPQEIGYDWIEVDEVQDNSLLQLLIIDLLKRSSWTASGDKKSIPVVYFGDPEQNIYSSIADTEHAIDYVRLKIGHPSHELHLRGNFRSEKELLEYFNKYSRKFFPDGSGNRGNEPFPVVDTLRDRLEKPDNFCDNPLDRPRVRHIRIKHQNDQNVTILGDILNRHVHNDTRGNVSGNTVVLFRRNDDVQSFYNDAINNIRNRDIGQRTSDVFMFSANNHIFKDKIFASIETLLLTAAGIHDPSWRVLMSHPHFENNKAVNKLSKDEQLVKTRQTPDFFLNPNPVSPYLLSWYYHLRNNWGRALRMGTSDESMALVRISAKRDKNNNIILTLHPDRVEITTDKEAVVDPGLRRSKISLIEKEADTITIEAITGKGVDLLDSYLPSKTFVADNAQELLCSLSDTPALLEILEKYKVWDPLKIHGIITNGQPFHQPAKSSSSSEMMVKMFYSMTHFDQIGGATKNLDRAQYDFFKRNQDVRNKARSDISRFYGHVFAKVKGLLYETDIETATDYATSDKDEGFLIERALRILCNELIGSDSTMQSYIDPVLTFCRKICMKLVEKDSSARNNLSLQVRLLRKELFGCTVPRLFKEGCVQSRIIAMTVHKSKGMTFDHVVVADAICGFYPRIWEKKYDITKFKEDHRLMYVAITRGRYSLTFVSYQWRKNKQGKSCRVWKSPLVLIRRSSKA